MPAKRKAAVDIVGRSSKRGTPAPSTPQSINSDDDFSGSDAASQDDADDSEKEHIRNYRKKLDFASFQGSKTAAIHPVFGEKDWSWMKLKPDHNNRPIWIDPNVSTHSTKGPKITMESFSPLAPQATDLLTTIAEPQSRPQFMHEYRFTEHSLYAALSVGLRGEDIINALDKLSKTPVPQPVIDFINRHTKTYGKVRMVLRDNKWFVESEDHDLLQLLQNDPVIGPCCASGLQSGTIQTKAAVIQGTKESRGMQQAQQQSVLEGQPEERTDVQVLMDSLRDEDDEDQDDTTYTNWFEILPHQRDTVAKQCLDIGYPAVAEYDFINDHVNPELSIDLRASTSIRPYQEKALSKMFGNGRGKSGIIVLPCGAGKTLVGITAGCHIKKSIVVLCTSAMSAHQWASEFRKWSDISEDDIAVFSATDKREFKGDAGVLVTTYSMITARGKRAYDTQQMLNWVYRQDWGLMILDEVHVVPAKMFRQVGSNIRAHCKLGLTATLLREDDKITDLNFLIGPKLYEANWMELADQGHIAKVQCAEVWCPMSMEFYEEYQKEKGKKRALYYMMNPVKFQYCQYLINFHEKRGDKIIVFSDNLFALNHYAKTINRCFIHGGTSNQERIQVLENFQHNDKINTLFLSKIGDTSLDLPEATCLIQISSHYGSRRQEAQRLGRILRAKRRNDEGFNAFFYSLVSKDTTEMVYSAKRQAFLVDQGYAFKTITHLAGMEKLPDLKYVDLRARLELLADVKMKTDTDAEVEAVKDDNWSHLSSRGRNRIGTQQTGHSGPLVKRQAINMADIAGGGIMAPFYAERDRSKKKQQIDIWDILQFVLHAKQPPHEPPISLKDYVGKIQSLSLDRGFSSRETPAMPRHIAVGMTPKKIHEVSNFASFVNDLSDSISERSGESMTLIDFGSGQNYLGRTLACPPYNKDVIAIEKKHHNVQGAQGMDVHAKLVKKGKCMRNKKEYKRRLAMTQELLNPPSDEVDDYSVDVPAHVREQLALEEGQTPNSDGGSMTYIEHEISDGDLEKILCHQNESATTPESTHLEASISTRSGEQGTNPTRKKEEMNSSCTPRLMAISLHSCGNLSHHGIRSLVLNRSVAAIAIIGCCYNLLTERLGPASYKIPSLRPNHPRLISTSTAYDPHGFPMSKVLEEFPLPDGGKGVRLNITARMMAVQAPYNWGREDSENFFRRHFYRALLQRILLDKGVVKRAVSPNHVASDNSPSVKEEVGTPLIVGSLRKSCFTSFKAYVRGALHKLCSDPTGGPFISQATSDLNDDVLAEYESKYAYAKKNLSIIWTLMAFSAGVVESIIAVDRWLYLKQQDCVKDAWVQPVFDYEQSPRNLCVVAVKKIHDVGLRKQC
ncbi:hypothetical protein DV736_g2708, partial [Chaetothyriales sp. CBS 134916]